ncbi:MAG: hypothetical protein PHQ01_03215 [Candidatus Pacebacteria bacterium]|jgi:hypothetical protein|nr:hypothetical protein [Candidatus Paceibacterota bacterium]
MRVERLAVALENIKKGDLVVLQKDGSIRRAKSTDYASDSKIPFIDKLINKIHGRR